MECTKVAVTRNLVHRRAVSEVFLTASVRETSDTFRIDGQWPRRHFFFDVDDGKVDILLVGETLRQATILVAHRYYGVPDGYAFLMGRLEVSVLTRVLPNHSIPADVEITVVVDGVRTGSQGVAALRTNLTFVVQGTVVATGSGELQVVDPRIYRRMRVNARRSDEQPTERHDPHCQLTARGVVLTPLHDQVAGANWQMVIDTSHPVLFDHPLDHVPGMLVMEASRQAARSIVGDARADMTEFNGVFSQFLDLDHPITMSAAGSVWDGVGTRLTIEIEQRGVIAARASVTLRADSLRISPRLDYERRQTVDLLVGA